jgi:hypothetical protein
MRPSWRSLHLGRRCSVATQSNRDCQGSQSERQQPTSTAHIRRRNGTHCEESKFSKAPDLRLSQRRLQPPAGAIVAHLLRGLPVQ